MIKNLLYSLFLHFLLLLVIYASFESKNIEETKTNEIAVSLIAISGNENSSSVKPNSEKKPDEKISKSKKADKKEEKAIKESNKNQATQKTKKLAQPKPLAKSTSKTISNEKTQEFKQEEEEKEEEQKENKKTSEDKQTKQSEDDKEKLSKEKDLDSKKKSEKEKSEENSATSESNEIANNLENLDLSIREKLNIQSQLKRCYARAIEENKLSIKFKISVKVNLSEDGYIDSNLDDLIDKNLYNNPKNPNYKIAIENIRRAIDLCSPLRNLPLDKYNIWKEVIFEFGEDDLLQK
jgi:outer membrane biosynthesis protein TonB